ncbi:oligosaccharide flippase family protein [Bacteroides acidifaciens]|uniref:oligosaccharide flippase family protein n=1 Tax=Bacteroides acidifaciens TaxID=85831 RepID=UPI0026EE6A4A|nr:oligosaccharide flippase family protein [Bacteroides acidifaciens]
MNQRKAGAILSNIYVVVINVIALVYTPYMLRMMGQSQYGLYGTANSFISYLSILSLGIGGAYIRFNFQCRAKHDREAEKKLNGMFLTIFSVLSLLVFIGGLIFIALSEKLVESTFTLQESSDLRIIMFILTLNMMVSFIFNVVMMSLQAYERFFFIRIVLLIAGIITPIANVIALNMGGRAVVISEISFFISLLSYIIFYIYARRAIALQFSFKGFDKQVMKELFVFSGFLFLNSITDQITFSTDNLVLSAVGGTTVVAVYTIGSSFKGYFQQISSSIANVFAPQINDIVANNGNISELDMIFIRIGRIQFYIVSLVLIEYIFVGYDFVCIWAGYDYKDAFYIGLLLILAVFVPAIQNIGLEIQKAKNMHKARSIVYFLIALVNVIITIPCSIKWGGIGAAFATTICMFLGTVLFMNFYYAKYIHLDIRGFWKSIYSILPGYVLPVFGGIIINRFWRLDSYFEISGAAVIILVVFGISIWNFSMNSYEKQLLGKPIGQIKEKMFKK